LFVFYLFRPSSFVAYPSYEPEMLRRLRDEFHHRGEVVSLSGATGATD